MKWRDVGFERTPEEDKKMREALKKRGIRHLTGLTAWDKLPDPFAGKSQRQREKLINNRTKMALKYLKGMGITL